ncbi:MAG: hypothetical protein KatS3mg111_0393 [Pirellulaceae bacterium]|nr:MAG: hypothetical protein KatS3mg111_0393 [Pirellulaceae bacterium]
MAWLETPPGQAEMPTFIRPLIGRRRLLHPRRLVATLDMPRGDLGPISSGVSEGNVVDFWQQDEGRIGGTAGNRCRPYRYGDCSAIPFLPCRCIHELVT